MADPTVNVSSWPKVGDVNAFFNTITRTEVAAYTSYWQTLTPEDYLETFDRWLFAFCSVHTTWESNIRGFEAIRPWASWYQDSTELKRRLTESRIGLQANRTRFIAEFCDKYWTNPGWYYKQQAENWVTYRNRLVKAILGLGPAKVSFALELVYPNTAGVVCLDTHMFQFYGLDQTKHARHYGGLETHWVGLCAAHNVPSPVARAIYWDRKQKQQDSRYWTYILERKAGQGRAEGTAGTAAPGHLIP